MAHAHGHGHHHHAHSLTGRKLAIACLLSCGILAVLAVGGWLAHSLALIADAGHVLTDIAALGLSWYATRQAGKPADATRTFGYHRTGILAALLNAVSLILIACWIGFEAYQRLVATGPALPVDSTIMMGVAAIGLVLNLAIGLGLKDESDSNLNVRSAFLHVMGDAAASAGVIVGALVIRLTGWQAIDPLLSLGIAIFIAFGAWSVLDECMHILMESVPRDLDLEKLVTDLRAIDGVQGVHDLHVWSLAQGMTSLSCHLLIQEAYIPSSISIVSTCNQLLADRYDIAHTTIQAEAEHCSPDSPHCNLSFVQPTHIHTLEATPAHHGHDHPHDHDHDHDDGHHHH
jgi:cobalt-zinc-cadmium efflux system protein